MALLPIRLSAPDCVLARCRSTFAIFERSMALIVRGRAQEHWGDGDPGLPHKLWVHECRRCVGPAVAQHMDEGSVWDAYVLGRILWQHLKTVFLPHLPAAIRDNDDACERLRACVHQVRRTVQSEMSHATVTLGGIRAELACASCARQADDCG